MQPCSTDSVPPQSLIWHMSGSCNIRIDIISLICVLLERIGCLKKESILKGFLFIKNKNKSENKKPKKLQHFIVALLLPYHQIYLLYTMFLVWGMMKDFLFNMTCHTKARNGTGATWLIWSKTWCPTTYGIQSQNTLRSLKSKNTQASHQGPEFSSFLSHEFSLICTFLLFIWVFLRKANDSVNKFSWSNFEITKV